MRKIKQKTRHTLRASVTLEAALVIPIFIYFLVNLMTLFDIARVQMSVEAALHQAGRETAIYAFDAKFAAKTAADAAGISVETEGNDAVTAGANVLSVGYASSRVRDYLETFCTNLHCVKDGIDGIGFLRSGFFAEGDVIDLVASYEVQPLIRVFGFTAFPMEARYYGHAWTGYAAPGTDTDTQENEEEMVYVAKTGTVYHRDAGCTYLNPSMRTVSSESIPSLRNNSGGKYYPCEVCGGGTGSEVIVTVYGDRYHANSACSALERTVREIPLSEAAGLRPCSKCGGSH